MPSGIKGVHLRLLSGRKQSILCICYIFVRKIIDSQAGKDLIQSTSSALGTSRSVCSAYTTSASEQLR